MRKSESELTGMDTLFEDGRSPWDSDISFSSGLGPELNSWWSQGLLRLLEDILQFQPATDLTEADEELLRRSNKEELCNIVKIAKVADDLTKTPRELVEATESISVHSDGIPSYKETDIFISSRWQRQDPKARGFRNPSSRCYRNAVLQALFHIPKLVNWIEKISSLPSAPGCVLSALGKLCVYYWQQPGGRTISGPVIVAFENCLTRTRTFQNNDWEFEDQNDAYAFLLHVLAAITETCTSVTYVMNSLLGHSTITRRICEDCKHQTDRDTFHEQERILSISWDRETSLDKVLSDREFNNVYPDLRCDVCKANKHHAFQKRLCVAPDVLIIHLMRFRSNNNGTTEKKSGRIKLTESLNLTSFTANGSLLSYMLQAVVHHQGSLDFGHYVTDAKGPHGVWERIDDECVIGSTITKALNPSPTCKNSGQAWTPYLLFYVKNDNQGDLEENLMMRNESRTDKQAEHASTEREMEVEVKGNTHRFDWREELSQCRGRQLRPKRQSRSQQKLNSSNQNGQTKGEARTHNFDWPKQPEGRRGRVMKPYRQGKKKWKRKWKRTH